MKIKCGITAAVAGLLLFSLTGCQLAKPDGATEKAPDRLIGVLVTEEYLDLFDIEGYLNDHLSGFSGGEITLDGGDESYEGRLYAQLTTRELTDVDTGEKSSVPEYVFQDVEGISYFAATMQEENKDSYLSSSADEGFSESHMSLAYGDEEDKITLDLKLYLRPGKGTGSHYANPVYQSADGRVYAMSGQGVSVEGGLSEGAALSQTMEESVTVTENGKSKKETTVIHLSMETMLPPQQIAVLEMDENSAILARHDYEPGKLPERIAPAENTRYLILESIKTDFDGSEKSTWEVFVPEDEWLESFYATEKNTVIKQSTEIDWQSGAAAF